MIGLLVFLLRLLHLPMPAIGWISNPASRPQKASRKPAMRTVCVYTFVSSRGLFNRTGKRLSGAVVQLTDSPSSWSDSNQQPDCYGRRFESDQLPQWWIIGTQLRV